MKHCPGNLLLYSTSMSRRNSPAKLKKFDIQLIRPGEALPDRYFRDKVSSGNPRKFRHGIYLVYTWYILLAFVILVYTRYMTGICFLGKSIFVYHWMHVCMQWLLPKYTIHRALDGDLFSKSYIEFNISMVYDRHLLGIHLVYTTFVLVLILSE